MRFDFSERELRFFLRNGEIIFQTKLILQIMKIVSEKMNIPV